MLLLVSSKNRNLWEGPIFLSMHRVIVLFSQPIRFVSLDSEHVQGQISEHIFAPNGGYCVSDPSHIFHNMHGHKNWGISLKYFPVVAGEYSVT